MANIATSKIVRFEGVAFHIQAGLYRRDPIINNQTNRYLPQAHPDHLSDADRRVRDARPEPRHEVARNNDREDKDDNRKNGKADKVKRIHVREASGSFRIRKAES